MASAAIPTGQLPTEPFTRHEFAGELALTPDQKPRFGALVLSDVTPYGIAPAEFATAIR